MITLIDLKLALKKSWKKETAYPSSQEDWNFHHPSYGQCAVTALIYNDYFGGDIYFNKENNHFYNTDKRGNIVDLTKEQFNHDVDYDFNVDKKYTRDQILKGERADKAKTFERYKMLMNSVIDNL